MSSTLSITMAHIVALLTDPDLSTVLEAAAVATGHEIDVCAGEAEAWDACEEHTDVLVVDASSEEADGVTLVDSMRAAGELRGVRTVAFHTDGDAAAQARAGEVGFDLVVPRSDLEADGLALIAQLLD
jgi:CheY-like chemotaxis protein